MRHLFLIGFMGAGKSTVGRLVADDLGLPFVDLDSSIEQTIGMPIALFFEMEGESAFRAVESSCLLALVASDSTVVACGGGVVVCDENRAALKRMGSVVYLRVTVGETIARVGTGSGRPLLSGPAGVLTAGRLLEARESLYVTVADAVVDTVGRTPDNVAAEVTRIATDWGLA